MIHSRLIVKCVTFGLLAWLGTAGVAEAQVTKTANGYLFRTKYHTGMHIGYVMKVSTTPPKNQSPVVMVSSVTGAVTSVQNKIATIKFTTGPAVVNGRSMGQPRTFEVQVDDQGKIVGGKIPGVEGLTVALPSTPIKIGASFPLAQSITIMGSPINIKGTYTLVGLKTYRGRQAAYLRVTLSGNGQMAMRQGGNVSFQTRGSGETYIDVADGMSNHVNLNQTMTIRQGTQSAIEKVTTTVDRK